MSVGSASASPSLTRMQSVEIMRQMAQRNLEATAAMKEKADAMEAERADLQRQWNELRTKETGSNNEATRLNGIAQAQNRWSSSGVSLALALAAVAALGVVLLIRAKGPESRQACNNAKLIIGVGGGAAVAVSGVACSMLSKSSRVLNQSKAALAAERSTQQQTRTELDAKQKDFDRRDAEINEVILKQQQATEGQPVPALAVAAASPQQGSTAKQTLGTPAKPTPQSTPAKPAGAEAAQPAEVEVEVVEQQLSISVSAPAGSVSAPATPSAAATA
jgi:hypothetical protein